MYKRKQYNVNTSVIDAQYYNTKIKEGIRLGPVRADYDCVPNKNSLRRTNFID